MSTLTGTWNKADLFSTDTVLQLLLTNLRVKNEEGKIQAAKSLQNYVSAQSREMSTENFKRWMNNLLKTHIWNLINSNVVGEKIGGIIAVDELIDVAFEEGAATSILAHYLHSAILTGEPAVMDPAAKAIGHLSRDNSTITAGLVEFEIKSALEWLQGERQENKRHAACLVLSQLAKNTPTLFYSYVPTFVDLIWAALRDPKPVIRECAVEALGACLELISKRENRVKQQWYQKIFEESLKGFSKQNSVDVIHGSLLTIGELLNHTGDFLKEKFNDVCQTVLKYKDHKQNLVRKAVIALLPRLAEFAPEVFVNFYLNECIVFLLSALSKNIERPTAFIALGQIATVVTDNFKPYLENTIILVKLGLTMKGKTFVCQEALTCTSMLARAVRSALQKYMAELLDLMFAGGLNQILTDALADLAQYIPEIGQEIRGRLLDLLSLTLSGKPYNYPDTSSTRFRKRPVIAQPVQPGPLAKEEQDKAIALGLNILGSFNFSGFMLSEFLRATVVNYLTDANPAIRKEAAICCCNIMSQMKQSTPSTSTNGYYGEVISEVLAKLLSVTVAETDSVIRKTVLTSLDSKFDHHLGQASNLASLFISLNDEMFEIRQISLGIICRLAPCNPAYVLPALRTTLIHLLTQLELSGDNVTKEESSKLLGSLIRDCPSLLRAYSSRILKALLPKLRDPDPCVSSSVLATLGELAAVSGSDVMLHVDELMPLIIETLQDQSSTSKREVALHTLGQLAESSGYVITPYMKYPKLLDALVNLVQSERNPLIRKEVISVLGILGALDPYQHRMNQLILEGRTEDEEGTGRTQKSSDKDASSESIANLSPSSEDYYPTITISALMRILKDPTLSIHHTTVIHVLMSIVKSLGMKSIQFLPQMMPPFLQVMKTCEPELRTIMFQQLGLLVTRVKQHIRDYLADIFSLVHQYWVSPNLTHIITLIEEISLALSDEFKPYLLNILPQLLQVFFTDTNPNRVATSKVLHALEVFGTSLDDYLHLVIPVIVKLCELPDTPVRLQIDAMLTLSVLCKKFNITYYASRILLPMSRILDTPNNDLQKETMKTLCVIVRQLGSDYAIFAPTIEKVIARQHIVYQDYENLVAKIREGAILDLDAGSETEQNPKSSEAGLDEAPLLDPSNTRKREKLNEQNLRRAWEVSTKSTKEDWTDWLRKFSVELLKESPSPALRSCISLATDYHPIVKELFNAAFVSCWTELSEQYQDELVRNLETALSSQSIPPEILQTLLNLAEFMEQDEKPLPIDVRTLAEHADNCHAYAKALHYKELEFKTSPTNTIEALISINNQLQQPEAALGILIFAQKNFNMELKESWYEKLHRWREALQAYERRTTEDAVSLDVSLGKMRCLNALGEWEKLAKLAGEVWATSQPGIKKQVAPVAASAAWNLSNWQLLRTYTEGLEQNSVERGFFESILAVHGNVFPKAIEFINLTRSLIDTELTALVGESYNRAYKLIVKVQQLAELEEIIKLKQQPDMKPTILNIWKQRLDGCERTVDTWQNILAVRSLVLTPIEDMKSWLKFCSLCRKRQVVKYMDNSPISGRLDLAHKTVVKLLGSDPNNNVVNTQQIEHPRVTYAYLKQKFYESPQIAFTQLKSFAPHVKDDPNLQARIYHCLGNWQSTLQNFDDVAITQIIGHFQAATKYDPNWYKAFHSWALANYDAAAYYEKTGIQPKIIGHVVPAIRGFFRSIALSSNQTLQDTLRILTLWFKHGPHKEVEAVLQEGFQTVSIDTWLQVIPQIIARIHATNSTVRRMINELLTTIGKAHPQALVYSLSVASKSNASTRVSSALSIMDKMKKHSANLVEQAQLVSTELIRVSILWHEMWHEGLEEASRTYFADHNTEAMLATLKPLHEMLERGPETLKEVAFQQAYGRDLQDAYDWCKKWERSKKATDLNQAWDLYYKVFRRINKQLPQMTVLDLQQVSPKLLSAKDLELAVPGTYKAGAPVIRIKSFNPTLNVITSKQRPRKLIINGSDGNEYMFLLKGHEDLRQDERVMQLFGLVNTLLASEYETSKDHLNIQRYSVVPLSPNSGLIGWFPHGDTLHQLIRDYRDSRKILINIEHRLMLQMAPDYDNLPLMQKVEAFEYALDSTNGQDLERILWLKSSNSEVWLDRRTNYTRSLAVMSMVGYILGLGDRHPSNLMLDRHTGKILHIDFGDCFEVAMHREKYPEKIPFRLTRMLINAMEVSGIEGTFRFTCEKVMKVMRENKESLIAVLEAFVYDPIINWRLLTTSPDSTRPNVPGEYSHGPTEPVASTDAMPEVLNRKALQVIKRVSNKLTGRDFGAEPLDIPEQVQKLIIQATSHENLCQCYIGWCPFW